MGLGKTKSCGMGAKTPSFGRPTPLPSLCPIDLIALLSFNSNFVDYHYNNLPNMETSAFVFIIIIIVLTKTCGGVLKKEKRNKNKKLKR